MGAGVTLITILIGLAIYYLYSNYSIDNTSNVPTVLILLGFITVFVSMSVIYVTRFVKLR